MGHYLQDLDLDMREDQREKPAKSVSHPNLVGDRWRDTCDLTTLDLHSEGEEGLAVVAIKQSGKGLPIGDVNIIQGDCVFTVVNVTPESLERLADFCNEAADMLRQCS